MTPKTEETVEITEDLPKDSVVIHERENFFHDQFLALIFLGFLLFGLTIGLLYLVILLRNAAVPAPTFFASTEAGQLIEEAPLEQPNIDDNIVTNWVGFAMMQSNTYNFISVDSVVKSAREFYTPEGYQTYQNAIAKTLDRVISEKLVLTATPTDAPQILLAKPYQGRYMWKIKIPMNFRYRNVTTDTIENYEITLIVMRVPTAESPNGISILKYEMEYKSV